MKVYYIIFLAIGLIFFSCKKDVTVAPDLGYDYYPGKIKSYVVYDVDSIIYNPLGNGGMGNDTIHYKFQIKEVMDTLITDNQNRPTIKIIRYKKTYSATTPYSAMPWNLEVVWVANKNNTDVEVVEENIRYTKLGFPARLGLSWNGTTQDSVATTYTYNTYDVALTLNGNSFGKTAMVMQKLDTNAVTYRMDYEQYARNVGLIYKQIVYYVFKQDQFGAHRGVIASGSYYAMTVNSYGTE